MGGSCSRLGRARRLAAASLFGAWIVHAGGLAQAASSAHVAEGAELAFGRALLMESRCAACHQGFESLESSALPAPDLSLSVSLRPLDVVADRIIRPQSARMPHVFGSIEEADRPSVIDSLVAYLSEGRAPAPPEVDWDSGDAARGLQLFNEIGCSACHGAGVEDEGPEGLARGAFTPSGLVAFLEAPLETRPDGSMPHVPLSHWEAIDLATYLLGASIVDEAPAPSYSAALVAEGAAHFQELGCVACHAAPDGRGDAPERRPKPQDLDTGCLSEAAGDAPIHYKWSSEERALARRALASLDEDPLSVSERVATSLIRLDCVACHQRDGVGGPTEATRDAFATDNLNLGEAARRPPTLNGVGGKFPEAVLFDIIAYGASHRPYMRTRMPGVGPANARGLARDLVALDSSFQSSYAGSLTDRDAREAGVLLVGTDGMGCVTCHTFDGRNASALNAVDLTTMADRLDRGWFEAYLRNPSAFQPDTIMPTFWPGGESTRPEILDGDASAQIEALWRYLSQGRQARVPRGLRREPIPLRASSDRAVMLRRAFRGIGKRGIGVGYPLGVNLAFDAGRMRLGSIWQGDFGDASGVWLSQGHGVFGEGARRVIRFPEAPAIARLSSNEAPWPVSEAEFYDAFQFEGYALDTKDRPTFFYAFEGTAIEDRFLDQLDPQEVPFLRRALRFEPALDPGLRLRLGVDSSVTALTPNSVRLENLGLRFESDHPLRTRTTDEGQVEVWVDLGGLKALRVDYHFEAQ